MKTGNFWNYTDSKQARKPEDSNVTLTVYGTRSSSEFTTEWRHVEKGEPKTREFRNDGVVERLRKFV